MFFPWEQKKKPYFVHGEFEWYYDKFATEYATKDRAVSGNHTRRGMKNVVAFYVRRGKTDQYTSVLIDNKQNIIFDCRTSIQLCDEIEKRKIWEDYIFHDVESVNQPKFEDGQMYVKEIIKFNPKIRKVRMYTHPKIKELYFDEHNNPIS